MNNDPVISKPTPDNEDPSPANDVAVTTPVTTTPFLAVIIPTESTLVTSSYVNVPLAVISAAVMLVTVIFGEPVSPAALVAMVAVVAVSALPVTSPLNVVAVKVPVLGL